MGSRLNKQQLYSLFDQLFQFTGLLRPDGTLIEANQVSLDFAGVERSAVVGLPFWETPWWTHAPELQSWLQQVIPRAAAGEFIRREVTHRHQHGEIIPFDFSLKPVLNLEGEVIYLIPEGRDIRERVRLEFLTRSRRSQILE